ncbi:MAG: hypothetical protein J6Z36_01335 [Clostridia bacterium]|nr:hypothetical protein [Clostridia bacterium]
MNGILANGTWLNSLACSAEECLSWIIVLLNILTVFYLAFCAWFKVTKGVKVFGWIWASVLTVSTVAVVFFDTCIFTLLCAVFTGLAVMAVLAVVLNKETDAGRANSTSCVVENNSARVFVQPSMRGSYKVTQTADGKFIFVLFNHENKAIATSYFCYYTSADAQTAACRMLQDFGLL